MNAPLACQVANWLAKSLSKSLAKRIFAFGVGRGRVPAPAAIGGTAALAGDETTIVLTRIQEEMMRNSFPRFLAALLVPALLIAVAVPVAATGPYGFQNSEGCDGTGYTYLYSTNVIRSETDAWLTGTSSDCHYSFLAGNYKDLGGTWHYGIGQGWISGGWNAHNVSGAVQADQVAHTACSTNTPSCPGVTYAFTGYY